VLCNLIKIGFFFVNWLVLISIAIFYVDFIAIIFIDLCMSTGAQNIIQLLSVNINKKILLVMPKSEFSSKSLDGATRYGSTNSPSSKITFLIVNLSLPSWTTSTWPLGLVFATNNQSTLERSLLREQVYV